VTIALAAAVLYLQDPAQAAVDKAVKFLRSKVLAGRWERPTQEPESPDSNKEETYAELILWTLVATEQPAKDPALQKLLKLCLDRPVWRTYNVALLALALQKLDPAAHKETLLRCGQFFLDTQCSSGHWSYGAGYKPARPAPGGKLKKAPLPADMQLPHEGDFSNSQFAALGIRSCMDAGVEFPEEMIRSAREAWRRGQLEEGSWPYRGGGLAPRGYASMTLGGVAAVAIFDRALKDNPAEDESIARAVEWMGSNFSLEAHPGFHLKSEGMLNWFYYYLYAMERAGGLLGAEKFGAHDWYGEGSKRVIKLQRPGGSWKEPSAESEIAATCFAALFLYRATAPVDRPFGGRRRPKEIETGDKK
jgi:hypothetical protein